ncbi:radical SAM/SPASM domain-containing protein [Fibrobacter sp. UWR2]|uniref:radical SAM/SPASM domain-containing protein n=1 Tax=Fibrobacter sp. UWR2 TaxID=1964352 RepID=UPI000B524918|nr:SPASM domain-containing protein [Fibrobacter sp. UWR2]OWU99637.1 radical SAM protein [Fibrobacter sp. UWR2]
MDSVYIEITNVCNLRCSFCPSSDCRYEAGSGKPHTFMSSTLFRQCIAGAVDAGIENVYLHVLGEPTLHPGFALFLKDIKAAGLTATLTTNGTTIARAAHHILNSPAVRQVNFSTHAYAELPPSDARGHLENVLDFCRMALAARPDMYINLRLWNIGDSESGNWNKLMLARVNETFGTQVAPGNFCSRHKSFPIAGRLYLHEDSRFKWPKLDESTGNALQTKDERSAAGTCHALDTHVAILHDGRVVACCLDYSGQITLGNIADQNLAEILGSPLARKLREGFEKHELRHPFCQKCSFCKRFGK